MKTWRQKNQQSLMKTLSDGLIFLKAADEKLRNGDVFYFFRQDSDFLYLTGVTQPGYALLLDSQARASHLFIPDLSELHRIWVGRQLTKAQAKQLSGTTHVHFAAEMKDVCLKLKKKYRKLYTLKKMAHALPESLHSLKKDDTKLRSALDDLRVTKAPLEVSLMRRANDISKKGHVAAMKNVKAGLAEYQLQAILEKEFRDAGATHNAYPSIVAAGPNAATLHYHDNSAFCQKLDLVLIDAAAEWHGYAADVTRAFPVSGKFSKTQKDIYALVLKTQKDCIKMVRPGLSMIDLHKRSCEIIAVGLQKLGIIKNVPVAEILNKEVHRVFYPHGVGHLLGLDVHDVGPIEYRSKNSKKQKKPKNLRTTRVLKASYVITVEPGIYFIEAFFDSQQARKKYAPYIDWKIAERYRSVGGIRIEDDILVTKTGHRNLTTVPKEIAEIEKLMR